MKTEGSSTRPDRSGAAGWDASTASDVSGHAELSAASANVSSSRCAIVHGAVGTRRAQASDVWRRVEVRRTRGRVRLTSPVLRDSKTAKGARREVRRRDPTRQSKPSSSIRVAELAGRPPCVRRQPNLRPRWPRSRTQKSLVRLAARASTCRHVARAQLTTRTDGWSVHTAGASFDGAGSTSARRSGLARRSRSRSRRSCTSSSRSTKMSSSVMSSEASADS